MAALTLPTVGGDVDSWGTELNAFLLSAVGEHVGHHHATGDGITDDTAAIQDAIDDCPVGGTVFLPVGLYKTTAALSITKDITIAGAGVAAVVGTAAASANGTGPLTSPYLRGAVLMPSTAGQNGITINGAGIQVQLRDFGIRFADPIRFLNTGHGIYSANSTVVTLGHEMGEYSPSWENVTVFGHDGNHYAFYMRNNLLGTFTHLRSYGGGGFYLECDADDVKTGNHVFTHPFASVWAGGTADAFNLTSRTAGLLNLCTYIRPQCLVVPVPAQFSGLGIPNPSVAQYMWRHVGDPWHISIYDPDLEGYSYANPVDFGGSDSNTIVRPGGIIGGPAVPSYPYATQRQAIDTYQPTVVTAGAGAGVASGGTATRPFGGNDRAGLIRIATGTAPAGAGNLICHVDFYIPDFRDCVFISPTNTTAAALAGFFSYGLSSTGFDVYATGALAPSTTYDFYFMAQVSYE